MTNGITYRTIKGIRYRCRDLGCDDFERAAYNRFIVANKLFTTFYLLVESWLTHTPLGTSLPVWMPVGNLPQVGDRVEFWGQAKREQEESAAEFLDLKEESKGISGDGTSILDAVD